MRAGEAGGTGGGCGAGDRPSSASAFPRRRSRRLTLLAGGLLALCFLPLPLHAGLLVVLATASFSENAGLLDLLVEAAKRALEGLVLTNADFCQCRDHLLRPGIVWFAAPPGECRSTRARRRARTRPPGPAECSPDEAALANAGGPPRRRPDRARSWVRPGPGAPAREGERARMPGAAAFRSRNRPRRARRHRQARPGPAGPAPDPPGSLRQPGRHAEDQEVLGRGEAWVECGRFDQRPDAVDDRGSWTSWLAQEARLARGPAAGGRATAGSWSSCPSRSGQG